MKESKTEDECQEEVKLNMVTEEGSPADIIVKKIKEEKYRFGSNGNVWKTWVRQIFIG